MPERKIENAESEKEGQRERDVERNTVSEKKVHRGEKRKKGKR
jgi:hypothetical protein